MSGVDFTVRNEGSIVLLRGVSPDAEQWIEDHVGGEDTQYWCGAVVVEHRYIVPIIEAMEAQGWEWEAS
jgi:hypothetical protein